MKHKTPRKVSAKSREAILRGSKKANAKQKQKALDRYYQNPNYCQSCGNIIRVGEKESPGATRRKKFCNHTCAACFSNKGRARPEVICSVCGDIFRKQMQRQKWCSIKCAFEGRYQEYIEKWFRGEESGGKAHNGIKDESLSNYARRWVLERDGNKCVECGWNETNKFTKKVPITVNHIDGNPYNHDPINLECLCPNCHALTPNYGGRNKGKGRKGRYINKKV